MGTIFTNSSDTHWLVLNLLDKANLKEKWYILLYEILAFAIHGKIKSHAKRINLKYNIRQGI